MSGAAATSVAHRFWKTALVYRNLLSPDAQLQEWAFFVET